MPENDMKFLVKAPDGNVLAEARTRKGANAIAAAHDDAEVVPA